MEYNSLKEMVNNIYCFLKRHSGEPNIVCADEPSRLMLGFMCDETGEYWHIHLRCLTIYNKKMFWNEADKMGRENFIEKLRRKAKNASL